MPKAAAKKPGRNIRFVPVVVVALDPTLPEQERSTFGLRLARTARNFSEGSTN